MNDCHMIFVGGSVGPSRSEVEVRGVGRVVVVDVGSEGGTACRWKGMEGEDSGHMLENLGSFSCTFIFLADLFV